MIYFVVYFLLSVSLGLVWACASLYSRIDALEWELNESKEALSRYEDQLEDYFQAKKMKYEFEKDCG